MGGEKICLRQILLSGAGSPPRGRGKAAQSLVPQVGSGITPAWAGKRHYGLHGIVSHLGSPPRGRGKEVSKLEDAERIRITPAWAGKSLNVLDVIEPPEDHPRVGGEKCSVLLLGRRLLGSPPRGRGKVPLAVEPDVRIGITPAWAGKRVGDIAGVARHEDHPRVGGEKTKKIP